MFNAHAHCLLCNIRHRVYQKKHKQALKQKYIKNTINKIQYNLMRKRKRGKAWIPVGKWMLSAFSSCTPGPEEEEAL